MIKSLQPSLEKHPFLTGFQPEHVALLAGCAKNVRFSPGEYLTREDDEANSFYLIRSGRVGLCTHGGKGGKLTVQTVGPGEMVGWSWLVPPHRYRFSAQALENTVAFDFDGRCLRTKCGQNTDLGYALLTKVSAALAERLEGARLQLLDVYGKAP